jgi:hypothetical protein
MRKKAVCYWLILLWVPFIASTQTVQFKYRVWISGSHLVKQAVQTERADTVLLKAGTLISSQQKYTVHKTTYTASITDTVRRDTVILAAKDIIEPRSLPGWATITVDKDDKSKLNINYWLGKKYDRNGHYYIQLQNREYASFWFTCVEGGALAIPFKYRPKFTKNGVDISDQLTADLNIGAYIGYTLGKITYMYRRYEEKEPSKWLVSAGPFLSISRAEIDSSSTLSAQPPLKTSKAIATLSPGLGLMTSVYNFRLGIFLGKDIAIGKTAQKWDYHNKWWWGFGIGYNIGLIWAPQK